jgi:carbonic anhydrase/acetyltransferase-like protein (isoleucine patch superfamily)
MTTFAVTDPAHTIAAINYALSNLGTGNVSGNVTIPGNVLVANTTTGVVSQYGNAAVFGYLYQWVNLRYSNNSTGGGGSFSTVPTLANYYGVFNSVSSAPSANPTDYQWYEVDGGFGLTKILYYSAIGGRQVQWAAANALPSMDYVASVPNVAINLDVVTTAAGTPGQRGPVVMAAVITTADPNTATSSTLTAWFSAPRDSLTAPIGTGLTPPVVGDTASFTYAAGAGQPQAAYNYNGSIWVPVDGQVISGNVIVRGTIAGNAMIANTITATQIAADTITGNKIAGNTITANNIAVGTITASQIAANTITGNNIAAGTITTNNFTANTIQGNIIAAGTITATQLAANAITANTVISSGAVLGSNASLGFWLDGPTGNARFGNSISIGNQLTVGSGANIGAGLIVGSDANIGTNLRVGNSAVIGNSVTIGTNLLVGANAIIGGNLAIAGLVTAGNLNANTVQTTTIVPSSVSGFASQIRSPSTFYSATSFSPGVVYFMSITLTAAANQTAYIWGGVIPYSYVLSAGGTGNTWILDYVTFTLQQNGVTVATWVMDNNAYSVNPTWVIPGYAVAMPVGTNTYRVGAQPRLAGGGNIPTISLYSNFASLLGQALKR